MPVNPPDPDVIEMHPLQMLDVLISGIKEDPRRIAVKALREKIGELNAECARAFNSLHEQEIA